MSLKNRIRWQIFLFHYRVLSVRSAAAHKMAKIAISLNSLRMKVIFRFLAKAFSDVAWFFAELSGDVETQERDDGTVIRQVTYK